jgi:hypothetical protein
LIALVLIRRCAKHRLDVFDIADQSKTRRPNGWMRAVNARPGCHPGFLTQVRELNQLLAGDWDYRRASFDKLRMRDFLRASKVFPHPELVEGRRMVLQRCVPAIAASAGATRELGAVGGAGVD